MCMFSLLIIIWIVGLAGGFPSSSTPNDDDWNNSSSPSNSSNSTFLTWSSSHLSNTNYTNTDSSSSYLLLLNGVSATQLSGLAIPSIIALITMYRLVPLHQMIMALGLVVWVDVRRSMFQ